MAVGAEDAHAVALVHAEPLEHVRELIAARRKLGVGEALRAIDDRLFRAVERLRAEKEIVDNQGDFHASLRRPWGAWRHATGPPSGTKPMRRGTSARGVRSPGLAALGARRRTVPHRRRSMTAPNAHGDDASGPASNRNPCPGWTPRPSSSRTRARRRPRSPLRTSALRRRGTAPCKTTKPSRRRRESRRVRGWTVSPPSNRLAPPCAKRALGSSGGYSSLPLTDTAPGQLRGGVLHALFPVLGR